MLHDHEKEFKEKILKNLEAERFLAIQSNNQERLKVLDVHIKAIREMLDTKQNTGDNYTSLAGDS